MLLRRVLRKGFSEGFAVRRVLRRGLVLGFRRKKGSQTGDFWKGVFRRCLERPVGEYDP